MAAAMRQVIDAANNVLSEEERKLFEITYKNLLGNHRASHRIILRMEWEEQAWFEKSEGEEKERRRRNMQRCARYRGALAEEIRVICTELFDLFDDRLLPASDCAEASILYLQI